MITLTIIERHAKTGGIKRKLELIHSMDKAKTRIQPIVKEMRVAEKLKKEPKIKIEAVSYDTKSEKTMLLELGAIISVENEHEDNY